MVKEKTKKPEKKRKTLVLLDGHAIIHRAFHALPALANDRGEQMGAVYGFTTILLRILSELKPDYIAAAFDMAGPTFRHVAYERYKIQRPKAPDELVGQFDRVRELVCAFGIPVLEKEGFEADDIIGTIAKTISKKEKNINVIIVTGDLDTLQLVDKNISVYTMRKGVTDTVIYDEKAVRERYGLAPAQLADFKGLRGDPSDNIPGIKGIGEKTASDLLQRFSSIEKLYAGLAKAKIPPSVREKLERERDEAFFSKTLATINIETPIALNLPDAAWHGAENKKEVEQLLREFGFNSLLRRLGYLDGSRPVAPQTLDLETSGAATVVGLPTDIDFSNEKRIGFFWNDAAIIFAKNGLYHVPKERYGSPILKTILETKRDRVFFGEKDIMRIAGSFVFQPHDFDILIATYLLRPGERSYTIERAAREAGIPASGEQAFFKSFEIADRLFDRLRQRNLLRIFTEIEMPLVPILAEIEDRGMRVDVSYLKELSGAVQKNLKRLEKEVCKLAGKEFNINSPKQVSEVLFTTLKLGEKGIRKTEGGAISTDARELAKLAHLHPIVGKILEYREVAKLLGTYIDALPKLVTEQGTLHTTLHQTLTSTGRLSSSDPNLQNIPTRSELGHSIRKAFVARKGYSLVSFDYSQIELRVAAAMSGDEKMKEAFTLGHDIHAMTAMEVNNVKTLAEVTPAMRYAAKALNFGVLYGMGPRAFSESAAIPFDQARRFMEEYKRDFPRIREFMQATLQKARQTGYVETMLGRRRYIPEINSPNWRLRAEAERMAMNAPIQGTATGDIVKLAMIKVDEFLKRQETRDKRQNDVGHILIQVHDELLCEIKESQVKKVVPQIKEIMEQIYDIGVPLLVESKVGKNWGEMEKLATNE